MSDIGNSDFVWTAAYEVQLMFAMINSKPVGINQHFNLARITEKFSAAVNRIVEPDVIWRHLGTWYDMDKLDDVEPLPFPNDEDDFELPEDEFGKLLEQVKKNSSRLERFTESQRKASIDARKENNNKDVFKEDDAASRNRGKVDKRTPSRRVSKSDKADALGVEEPKEKTSDKEKTAQGGRTRRSMKTDESAKEESGEIVAKKIDSSTNKKPPSKKESGTDDIKKKIVSEAVDSSELDPNSRKITTKTPSRNPKEPEKTPTPKRVTRASVTPAELESAKKKRRR